MQTPALQVAPGGHGLQPPQWVVSPPLGGTQAPSAHCVSPVGQLDEQAPLLHTSVSPQTVVHEPQCDAFEGRQLPLHRSRPALQAHCPAWQAWPVGQMLPHAPQFIESVARVAQLVPHFIWPAVHIAPLPPAPVPPCTFP
jgi:hypothetical protein